MTAKPVRIVIAEDHFLVREGTRKLLESSGVVTVVAAVEDKAALMESVQRFRPDCVVVDIRMPPSHQMEGIEAAHEIKAQYPATGVVVLSQYVNALYAFRLFKDGTAGLAYLLKDRIGDLEQLMQAVTAVTNGQSVIDPQVVEGLLASGEVAQRAGLRELTPRERDVLQDMAEGKSNRAIAESLHVSESAVEKHVSAVFAKLELESGDASVNRRVAAVLTYLQSYPGRGSVGP